MPIFILYPALFIKIAIFLLLFNFKAHTGEEDLYDLKWLDQDQKVFVLQNKIYPKINTYYLDIKYLSGQGGQGYEFQSINGVSFHTGYFWSETQAIELGFSNYTNSNNSAFNDIRVVGGVEPFIRRPINRLDLWYNWSPFYGKINTFNKIIYFDAYFSAGLGYSQMESNLKTVIQSGSGSKFEREVFTTFSQRAGLKVHITRNYHISVEYINVNYMGNSAKSPKSDSIRNISDISIGFGISY